MVTEAHDGQPLSVPWWYVVLSIAGAVVLMAVYGFPMQRGNFWPEGPLFAYALIVGSVGGVLAFYRSTKVPADD